MSYKLNQPSKPKFSVFVSYSSNKMIIRFPNNIAIAIVLSMMLLFVAVDIFWGANLPVSLSVSVIDELFIMPRALNSSRLNCTNEQGQISCSLSGNYLFGKEEKVIDDKRSKLLKAKEKSIDILSKSGRLISRNDLLVLVTEKEEIYLYTNPDLLDIQINKLSDFLYNRNQSNLLINANKSYPFNIWCIRGYYSYNIFICMFSYSIILVLILILLSDTAYIFDKNIGKLTALARCGRRQLFEIEIDKIKSINLEKKIVESRIENSEDYLKLEYYIISFIDVDDKSYFTMPLSSYGGIESAKESEAHKIADSICLFLNLGTYSEIFSETSKNLDEVSETSKNLDEVNEVKINSFADWLIKLFDK